MTQKIVVDTNVLVSAAIQRGLPHTVLNFIFHQPGIEICVSDDVLAEYNMVFQREKFQRYSAFATVARDVLEYFSTRAKRYHPATRVQLLSDPDDNKFLELALASKADFIITGNKRHFTMDYFQQTRIATPTEYWELFKPK